MVLTEHSQDTESECETGVGSTLSTSGQESASIASDRVMAECFEAVRPVAEAFLGQACEMAVRRGSVCAGVVEGEGPMQGMMMLHSTQVLRLCAMGDFFLMLAQYVTFRRFESCFQTATRNYCAALSVARMNQKVVSRQVRGYVVRPCRIEVQLSNVGPWQARCCAIACMSKVMESLLRGYLRPPAFAAAVRHCEVEVTRSRSVTLFSGEWCRANPVVTWAVWRAHDISRRVPSPWCIGWPCDSFTFESMSSHSKRCVYVCK